MSKAPVWNCDLDSVEQYERKLEETQNTVLVLEIYTEWAGICKAIQNIFKKTQFELGGDKVQFAHVKAELLPQYSAFVGKSRPLFDIYKNGKLKHRFGGCQMPQLMNKITDIINSSPDEDILPEFDPETAIAEERKIEAQEEAEEELKAAAQQQQSLEQLGSADQTTDYKAGKVHITLVGVHDVVSLDAAEKSDPYFKVKFADSETQTKKLKNAMGGQYNQDFTFDFDPNTTQDRELKLELWDYDTVGKDDLIGKADIPIKIFRSVKKQIAVNINGTGDNYGQRVGLLNAVVLYEVPYEKVDIQTKEQSFEFTGVEYNAGKVTVKLINVSDVTAMDSNGKSDPYMKVRFDGNEYQTKKMKDVINGEFNEEFQFDFDPEQSAERQVLIELWDYDTVGDNDQIGNARIQISEFRNKQRQINIDFRGVGKLYGQKVGKLTTEVLYEVTQTSKKSEPKTRQQSDKNTQIKQEYKAGKLNLNIIGVKEVAAADTNDKSDPYIVVKFAGIEDKTEKQNDATEAVYNKQFTFDFDPDATEERQVNLELWDYNAIGKNELLGKANVPIPYFKSKSAEKGSKTLEFMGVDSRFLQNVGNFEYEAIYIGPEGGQGSETISSLIPRTSSRAFPGEDGQPSIDELERTARINEQDEGQDVTLYKRGKIRVRIVGVRDIEPIYKGGKSDAFVLVKFNDEEKKTLTVKDTLNAEFNEEFMFDFDPENVEDKTILFELWDSDNITKNDFLGQIKTRLGNYKDASHFLELEFYGFDDRADMITGVLDVEIEYETGAFISRLRPRTSTRSFAGEDGKPGISELENQSRIYEEEEGQIKDMTKYQKGKVSVRIVGVRDIDPINEGQETDIFVLMKFQGEEMKTSTVNNNLNALFHEEFRFDFDPQNTEEKNILFELWDSDNVTKHDFLGEIKTRLRSCKDSPLFLELYIYGFDERSDKVVEFLDVEIGLQISQNDEDNSTQFDTASVNQQPIKIIKLIGKKSVIINLIGVRNVAAMDTIGKSDPYIKVIFDDQLIGRTKKVADTVNAEYNEEFNFEIDPEVATERKLLLELWDHVTLSGDDRIGKVQLQLLEFLNITKS
ncbi:MAG: hypothetical protein EZS28_010036 [Streblomastix strix]|uniref:C2 domain-containing protein n=1 Tax=Streblomastix strix TaxID=222440 RepID=A0A5J4WJA2_9EUKA|nr:MAG: hypothetical protein EZS28_010036 [Streblomastix strix]